MLKMACIKNLVQVQLFDNNKCRVLKQDNRLLLKDLNIHMLVKSHCILMPMLDHRIILGLIDLGDKCASGSASKYEVV